jgi:hypothetical protein
VPQAVAWAARAVRGRPHPRPGKRGALGHLRSHEPVRVRHPTPILCLRRAVGSAGRLEQGWARATRPSAPRQTHASAGAPTSETEQSPGGGLCAATLRTLCASVAVLKLPLVLIWVVFLERDRGAVWASTAFPTIASPGLFFFACHLWQKSSGPPPRAKFHVAAHRRPPHPPRRKTGFGAFSAPDQLTDTTGRVSRFLRPRTFVPSLHTSYLTWNRRQILRPHRAVLFSQWWLLGASPSLT